MSASTKRPLSSDEAEAIAMLRGVTFTPASWDKRFAAHLQDCSAVGMIGEKAAPQLWRIFIRYRRQTHGPRKAELLAMASQLSAPDLRKVAAAQREQARIDSLKYEHSKLT